MADLKSMFARMGNDKPGGAGDNEEAAPAPKAAPKKGTIEKTYQKKSQLEHILLRPDTYIGSVEKHNESMWVFDTEANGMVQRQIEYSPGLYKIFDEILVNAADNKQRDAKMDCIKIEINGDTNTISVWNNGKGIPVVMHKDEKMFVPTMIFGHLLTSSNYNDEEEKVTGGRNGYGAKLCNIFSTKFTVETASKEYKKQFKQTWGNNMSKASEAKVKEFAGEDFTKITFSPDLVKFKMDKLDDDIIALMSRRAYDIAASSRGVKVFLNGKRVPVKNFKDYVELYVKGKEDDNNSNLKVVYESVNERWEVAMTLSDRGFQQMSFVNSIATTKGGRHVDYVVDMMVKQLIDVVKKKNKGGVAIKPFQVKTHMWVFVNCLIVNPTFDSQTKENMTLQTKNFGSKCILPEKFINSVVKSGIVEAVLTWAKFKAETELNKKGGKKQSKLKGVPKLEDANEAGTKNALKCTLILTEGDSAKSLAVSGLSVIGRDYYGVFPLKGKLLNVREATHKQILENQEINNLVKIIGLQYKKKYATDDDMKTLRYGKVMIMTDQDQDGSHIKGLLVNFIHYNWPELLHKHSFLEVFITPIVKAKKKNQELSFYSIPEFEEWKTDNPQHTTYQIKYYKGLGTSTSKEAQEYFSNMARHRVIFKYKGQEDDDNIVLAFSKKHIEHRKEWLTNFMVESKRRKEVGLAEKYLYTKDTKYISYSDFINLELILFSNADNIRSIPSMVDGLKPGQRKVMYTCFKRNDKREVKVAQLAGSVAEMSAYHHGEVSLCMTIVNLAQNYIGSNNINLLEPNGQFGTRMNGGKDSASPRYIFTKMSPLTRMLFHPHDDPLLKYEYDDNVKIEPVWYIPIIPMVLVNGADGIGTGWMTKIPNYDPRELVSNIRRMLDGEEPLPMIPFYKNFKGTIEDCGDHRYVISGEMSIVGTNTIEITELPVGTWTQHYKETVIEPFTNGTEKVKAIISDYKEYNTDTTIRFLVTVVPSEMARIEAEGLHKVFKLQSVVSISSMCAFDEMSCLKRFDSVEEILRDFYKLRLTMYQKRKDYLEGMLKSEADKLSNQARFILEKCNQTLVVENKKRKAIVDELIQRGYDPDPVHEWKKKVLDDDDEQEEPIEEEEGEDAASSKKKPVDAEKAFKNLSEVKKFDYLLGMSMWMLTEEKKNELLRQRDKKLSELEILRRKTNSDIWRADLDEFIEKLDQIEEKERKDEASTKKVEKKGKKKAFMQETMPSPMAKRIAPVISDDLKKRIQAAVKQKENKGKRGIKKDADMTDESDVKEKKSAAKKATKEPKDGMKQTKLNFKKSDKVNGSPKKRDKKTISDSEDDDDISGSDFESTFESPRVKERVLSKRAATKQIKFDSSEESAMSENDEMFDNNAVLANDFVQEKLADSDEDDDLPPPKHETSEDMFDSLVGRKKEEEKPQAQPKKPAAKRKKAANNSDSESSAPKATKKKKSPVTSDSESESPPPKPTKKKNEGVSNGTKKGKKKPVDSESDTEIIETSPLPVKKRAGRAAAKSKYVFDDSDSD